LILGPDNWEALGAQIAQLLADEVANQRALAAAYVPPSGDPAVFSGDYAIRVFHEVSDPWEMFKDPTEPPVVSVRCAGGDLIPVETKVTEQVYTWRYYLDIGAAGQAADTATGHLPGDQDAAIRIQRAIRLIRQILSSGPNQYLQKRGIVGWRRLSGVEIFQPDRKDITQPTLDHIAAARILLEAKVRDVSPEYQGEPLEDVAVDLKKGQDGSIIAQVQNPV
jgi:hypothetical protein